MFNIHHKLLLGICLVISLIIFNFFSIPFYLSDDNSYFTAADLYSSGIFSGYTINGLTITHDNGTLFGFGALRLIITLPIALSLFLMESTKVVEAYQICLTLIVLFLSYRLAKVIKGRHFGLMVLLFLTFCPMLFRFAGSVLPDIPLTLFLLLGFFCLLKLKEVHSINKASLLWTICLGFTMFFAYSAKISSLIFIFVFPFFWFPCELKHFWPRLKSMMLVCFIGGLSFLFLVFVEHLFFYHMFEEFYSRFSVTASETAVASYEKRIASQGSDPLTRVATLSRYLSDFYPQWTQIIILGLVSIAAIYRQAPIWVHAWFWIPLTFLLLGSTSFDTYRPPPIQARYFIPIIPAAAILSCLALKIIINFVFKNISNIISVSLILSFGLWIAGYNLMSAGRFAFADYYNGFRDILMTGTDISNGSFKDTQIPGKIKRRINPYFYIHEGLDPSQGISSNFDFIGKVDTKFLFSKDNNFNRVLVSRFPSRPTDSLPDWIKLLWLKVYGAERLSIENYYKKLYAMSGLVKDKFDGKLPIDWSNDWSVRSKSDLAATNFTKNEVELWISGNSNSSFINCSSSGFKKKVPLKGCGILPFEDQHNRILVFKISNSQRAAFSKKSLLSAYFYNDKGVFEKVSRSIDLGSYESTISLSIPFEAKVVRLGLSIDNTNSSKGFILKLSEFKLLLPEYLQSKEN